VFRASSNESSTRLLTLAVIALISIGGLLARAAVPYSEATVTRVQNKVSYGVTTNASKSRPAAPQDVVRAMNYLLSESDSRAELQYPDGTIVRIGQNTVFSFEADTRTLNLTKGTFIFYVPKGQGGATIKTPSLTAAITGTVGKVSNDTIAIIEGSVTLPSGQIVGPGQYARRNPDGSITIGYMTPGTETTGKLFTVFGPFFIPGELMKTTPDFTALVTQETLDRTANHPNALGQFFPPLQNNQPPPVTKPTTIIFVPPPLLTPPNQNPPHRSRPSY